MPSNSEPALSPQQLADRSVQRMQALTNELHDTMLSHHSATFEQCESAAERTLLAITDMETQVDQLYEKLNRTIEQLESSVDTMMRNAIQSASSHVSGAASVPPDSITASCLPSATHCASPQPASLANCTPATAAASSRAPTE
ncbi:hypothetical protein BWQ96_09528 [Gracilariopsis chorda]|uniref:Uncharacterized protein n=1 Tax=Gracilariopsis chorda TaxID=448386 RepID=A0A2V3IFA1_9FLOR|nr:hypothetical protein BWQ96_09528 [Gracilariopsis chorda]|eukprot:PXF40766.1 hypothetical protein BWQ96_09528 [Gracilariopsis chorda]